MWSRETKKREENLEGVRIADDMRKMELRREDAQDRVLWKNSIWGNRPTRASAEKQTLKQ